MSFITVVAIAAFAGNSVLCRVALTGGEIDAASFTVVRILSGALMLLGLIALRTRSFTLGGNWWSALALFAYAAGFSFAYVSLSAATGALLLFGAVQVTMIGYGIWSGERLNFRQFVGVIVAVVGLFGLLLPGVQAPPLLAAVLMLGAGVAWGIYSLRGRGVGDPTLNTAGNFGRAVPMALALSVVFIGEVHVKVSGVGYAVASGALASGLGYAVWYMALPQLRASTAATVQLCVPVLAAIGGVVFLAESVTSRLIFASIAILGGVAFFIVSKPRAIGAQQVAAGDV